MHILGKIMIWLVVLGIVGPLVLTSKVVAFRNSWTKKIESLQESNEKKQQELATKDRTLRELQGELSRIRLGWDRCWEFDARVANGMVSSNNFGTNAGFGFPPGNDLPVVHLFMPDDAGGSRYVGAFQPPDAGAVREENITVRPIWRVRTGEEQSWGGGAKGWRCRTKIPSGYARRFVDLYAELSFGDELFAGKEENRKLQERLLALSKEHLDYRLQELHGPPEPKEPPSDDESNHFVIGLVRAIERVEEQRNDAQARVDRLRREMEQAKITLQEFIDANRELAKKLAQPTTARTADAKKN